MQMRADGQFLPIERVHAMDPLYDELSVLSKRMDPRWGGWLPGASLVTGHVGMDVRRAMLKDPNCRAAVQAGSLLVFAATLLPLLVCSPRQALPVRMVRPKADRCRRWRTQSEAEA
jgi:hypothetical protein